MKIEQIHTPTHEKVLFCRDDASGLRAFIAIHDTTLGPSLGGCRMWRYDTAQEALADALRLSTGMTAKSALAGVPFGGGKAVILGDPKTGKTPEKMRAFGRFVEHLNGAYITSEDVGMTPRDLAYAAEETEYVVGLQTGRFATGDPSPVTADGVFRCMQVAAKTRLGSADLSGVTVAIQGLGHVGMVLAQMLNAAGARIVAADPNTDATRQAAQELRAEIVAPDDIPTVDAEIFAPCALGGSLNAKSIPTLKAKLVCGSANNQLAKPEDAQVLASRGILYCPDYVVNSGGLISVASEALKIEDLNWIERKLSSAVQTFAQLLVRADREHCLPLDAANGIVADILRTAPKRPQAV